MYCLSCGNQINDGTKFCPFCGAKQAAADRGTAAAGGYTESQKGHGYIRQSLAPDERLIMQVGLGWCSLIRYIIVGGIFFTYFLLTASLAHRTMRYWNYRRYGENLWTAGQIWTIVIGIIICVLIILVGVLRKLSWEMGFTDRRLIKKVGFIRERSIDIPLNKINNVILRTGLFGRMMNIGRLHILTSSFHGRGSLGATGIGVKKAARFRDRLVYQINRYEKGKA